MSGFNRIVGPKPWPCGSCSLCCKLVPVEEIEKRSWDWCPHCAPGKERCRIYETRPPSCRAFQCLWTLWLPQLPEELRPDRCKAVLEMTEDGKVCLVLVDPGRPDAPEREPLRSWLAALVGEGVSLVIRRSREGRAELVLPPGRSEADVEASVMATYLAQKVRSSSEREAAAAQP